MTTYRSRRFEGLENFVLFQPYSVTSAYDIPTISPVCELKPLNWQSFAEVRCATGSADMGVHFFLNDYRFNSVWLQAAKYVGMFPKYGAVMSPDFSTYRDMPKALQIYNHYRKHWCAQYWQSVGAVVIPTISWSTPDSFEWCFDGEPVGCSVAISTVGVERDKNAYALFVSGYEEMLERLKPAQILVYGKRFDFMTEDGITVVEPFFKQMKERVNNGR